MPMIRIHHGEGPAPAGLRKMKGYDLDTGTTTRGGTSLIYLFKAKNEFGAYCQQHAGFNIITGLGNTLSIGVGMYNKGRAATSKAYDAQNLLHVKARMLGTFGQLPAGAGKIGVRGHRVSMADVANKLWEGANWIASPGEKITEKALHDSRYFVVFTNAARSTIMHQQEELVWVLTDKSHFTTSGDNVYITLGTVDTHYRNQIENHLKNF